ncbi:unnamed protein product [Clonostachys solani]|uniref:Uncharacterized protein n=1 Tax=Clonostachys solani TaxID=160281 RepID=A0A9N9ZK48_9HYPO|nr:unnamed protein product [Clonostachys solani]
MSSSYNTTISYGSSSGGSPSNNYTGLSADKAHTLAAIQDRHSASLVGRFSPVIESPLKGTGH